MGQLDDHDYYAVRAEASRRLATCAASPGIAAIHLRLATLYDLVAQDGTAPPSAYQAAVGATTDRPDR